jgi:hypothetical protein
MGLVTQDMLAGGLVEVRRENLQRLVLVELKLQGRRRHIDARFFKRFLQAAKVLRDAVNERAFHIEDIAREHTGTAKVRNIR